MDDAREAETCPPEGAASRMPAVPGMGPVGRQHLQRLRLHYQRGRHSKAVATGDLLDLDLEAMGLIRCERSGWNTYAELTEAGKQALFAGRECARAARSVHDTLGARLARWLRAQGRLAWEHTEFMVEVGPGQRQAVRPDVFSIMPTYDLRRAAPVVYEVKRSRADFLADVAKPHKRGGYARLAGKVIYVAPAGLLEPAEIPAECGLLEEHAAGQFRVAKSVRAKRVLLSTWVLLKLVVKENAPTGPEERLDVD